jgi:VWFA-related protein
MRPGKELSQAEGGNYHMGNLRLLLSLSTLLLFASLGGSPDLLGQGNRPYLLRVNVDWVTIPFWAHDRLGRPVEHFCREDLLLLEDGEPQAISTLETKRVPLTMAVLLDCSESMGKHARAMKAAIHLLEDNIEGADHIAVLSISNNPRLLLDFTGDFEQIRHALDDSLIKLEGASNISDTIFWASHLLSARPPEERKVIFLISDGNGNRGDDTRALKSLKSSGTMLLGTSIGHTSHLFGGAESLHRMIRDSGGRIMGWSADREINAANFRKEFRIARSQFQIGYVPLKKRRDGKWRQIELLLAPNSPDVPRGITISAPSGYPSPQPVGLALSSDFFLIRSNPQKPED